MQFAELNGIILHYSDTGSHAAPALVFSNSLGTDFRVWDALVPHFASRFRIIRYDKRGHGLSGAPAAPYTMEDHVGDLAALLDHLGVSKASIVGLSVGGMIAQGLLASRPDLVARMVLMDTAHRIGTRDAWNERIASVQANGIASISGAILERWFSPTFRQTSAEAVSLWQNMLERTPVAGYAGTCAALRDADYTKEAGHIGRPVLLMVGSNDGSTPPELVRSTHELIAGSKFVVIDGPGHLPCVESPAETAAHINRFLQENSLV
ncbi:MAG: 3-oxoadipate enol-lactonase [Rhizobiaceae bacterium]